MSKRNKTGSSMIGKGKLSVSLLSYVLNEKERTVIGARTRTKSNRAVSRATGIPRRTVDHIVDRVVKRALEDGFNEIVREAPKLLFLDIETAPALSYVWSMFQKGPINPEMQVNRTEILGFCAKWFGVPEDDTMAYDRRDKGMLDTLWYLLDEADYVCAHNGDRFDIKRINTEFLLAGFKPPSPYKQIDTLKMVKRSFGFDSNRLDYLSRVLFGEGKEKHDGFSTWVGCMQDDPAAWDTMMHYCAKDVVLLERLYIKVRGWDKGHPNILLGSNSHMPDAPMCTTCGSSDVIPTDKTVQTNVSRFVVWECGECGTHMRERVAVDKTELVRAK